MQRLSFAALTCSAVLLAATGCGGVRHTPVTGLVTIDGQPYENVMVTFVPTDGGNGALPVGRTDATGKFRMGTETSANGVKPGKYKVTVLPGPAKDSQAVPHPSVIFAQQHKMAGGKVNAEREVKKLEVERGKANRNPKPPAVYADSARTPLEVEVANEPRDIKLELKSNAK
jgi:hypothetical protein